MATQSKKSTLVLLGATAVLLTSFAANAAVITIDSIAADWTNVVGGVNVNYIDTDTIAGNEEIRWGTTSDSQSGYRFAGAAPASFNVDTGVEFSLGDFTHFNFPINADTGISGAQLNITTDLHIGGSPSTSGPFTFSFLHDETSNSCSPLPGCANDLVSFSNLISSDTFMIGSEEFTLELLGFKHGGVTTLDFSTVEGDTNVAQLMAIFRAPTTSVPEPGMLALLSFGLLAMGMTRKQRS